MPASTLVGTWVNEFGSTLTITAVDQQTGVLSGTYASHTGAAKEEGKVSQQVPKKDGW